MKDEIEIEKALKNFKYNDVKSVKPNKSHGIRCVPARFDAIRLYYSANHTALHIQEQTREDQNIVIINLSA